jgi:hypothetical protein
VTRAGWIPQEELDLHAWVTLGKRFGRMGRGVQWWIGDWLRYGSARWGEKYADAARITGYDPGSLRNMVCLANEFDLSRRRDTLAWSHHAAVAGLVQQEQERWLDHAERAKLSVADLRLTLRASHRSEETAPPKRQPSRHEAKTCPPARVISGAATTSAAATLVGDPQSSTLDVICPMCGHVYRSLSQPDNSRPSSSSESEAMQPR